MARRSRNYCPAWQHGPEYNIAGAGLDKFRRLARKAGSLVDMPASERQAYGEAVELAVKAKQRSELMGALESVQRCPCASGTWLSDGKAISAAVRKQQRTALLSCPSRNAGLTPERWAKAYAEAMALKRANSPALVPENVRELEAA